jgi:hypothetical protein
MAYSLVAHTKQSGIGTFTTPAIDTTGAKLLIVFVAWYQVYSLVLSDSKGNTWTPLTKQTKTDVAGLFFYCTPTPDKVGSGHTFTLTGPSRYATMNVLAFSDALSSPFDAENGSTATGTSLATGSVSPSVNGELIVAGLATYSADTIGIDSSFIISDQTPFQTSSWFGAATAYLSQTTKSAVNPTFSWTNSADSAAAVACFKPSSETSGGSPFIFQPFAI